MGIDSFLDEAEAFREKDGVNLAFDVAALTPGANMVADGLDAELHSLLAMRDFRDGNYMSGMEHEGYAAYHAGSAALNFLTMGQAGPALTLADNVSTVGDVAQLAGDATGMLDVALGGGHSIADAASSQMRTRSLGDAARAGFDHSSINAIPAGGGS